MELTQNNLQARKHLQFFSSSSHNSIRFANASTSSPGSAFPPNSWSFDNLLAKVTRWFGVRSEGGRAEYCV